MTQDTRLTRRCMIAIMATGLPVCAVLILVFYVKMGHFNGMLSLSVAGAYIAGCAIFIMSARSATSRHRGTDNHGSST